MLCDMQPQKGSTWTSMPKERDVERYIDFGKRGLLSNWPAGVVAVCNGVPITKQGMLRGKRERQAARLASIRRDYESVSKPCFVWVFYNYGFPYGPGWWLYVRTAKRYWYLSLGNGRRNRELILSIMSLFPCNYLPMPCFFRDWKAAFAGHYPQPTAKRPRGQGMAIARAIIGHGGDGNLLAVEKWE